MSRKTHLKIKIKTLAAEATIIRHEEARALANPKLFRYGRHPETGKWGLLPTEDSGGLNIEYMGLKQHRVGIVRTVARDNLLAYGFLRGRSYAQMERTTKSEPRFGEVEKIARRFDEGSWDSAVWVTWLAEAKAHLKSQAETKKEAA